MAEQIVIKITADTSDIAPGVKEVEKLGTAAEKDVAAFNKLNNTIGKETTDAVKKVVISAEQARKAFADTSKGGKDGFAQIREEVKKATKEVDRHSASYKTLKQQILEAKQVAASFADQNSKEAIAAQKNVANLVERQDDLNKRVQALNPEAKFQAFTQVTQGLFGAFQGLTGAMQLFGLESEEAQKIAQQFQGAINLTQGLNSVLGLKDAFGNLRAVLGLTAAAQTTLAVATEAQAAATVTATTATYGFSAALTATGIGAIVVAIGALVAGYIALTDSINEADDAIEEIDRRRRNSAANEKLFDDVFDKAQQKRLRGLEMELEILKAKGAPQSAILQKQKELLEVELATNRAAIASAKGTDEFADKLIARDREIIHQLQLIQIEYAKFVRGANVDPVELQFTFPTVLSSDQQSQLKELAKQFKEGLFDEEAYKEKVAEVMGDVISLTKKAVKENPVVIFDPADTNATDLSREYFDQQRAEMEQFYDDAAAMVAGFGEVLSGSFEVASNLSQTETDARIADLDRQKEAGIISNEQYLIAVKQARQDQAAATKLMALYEAGINAAVAIINALKVDPTGALAIKTGIITALQLAAIASRPVPQFKKGRLPAVPGSFTGQDNELAYINPKEAILTAEQTFDYYPTISAIYKRKITPAILNAFVKDQRSTTVKHKVKASINPYDMRYAMDGMGMKIKNVDQLSDSIASKILKGSTNNRVREKNKL